MHDGFFRHPTCNTLAHYVGYIPNIFRPEEMFLKHLQSFGNGKMTCQTTTMSFTNQQLPYCMFRDTNVIAF